MSQKVLTLETSFLFLSTCWHILYHETHFFLLQFFYTFFFHTFVLILFFSSLEVWRGWKLTERERERENEEKEEEREKEWKEESSVNRCSEEKVTRKKKKEIEEKEGEIEEREKSLDVIQTEFERKLTTWKLFHPSNSFQKLAPPLSLFLLFSLLTPSSREE